jgi:hypothetical protein
VFRQFLGKQLVIYQRVVVPGVVGKYEIRITLIQTHDAELM